MQAIKTVELVKQYANQLDELEFGEPLCTDLRFHPFLDFLYIG